MVNLFVVAPRFPRTRNGPLVASAHFDWRVKPHAAHREFFFNGIPFPLAFAILYRV